MRTLRICALLSASLIASAADSLAPPPDYKPGWDVEVFYKEVLTCRTAIVLPAANAYSKRGAAQKMEADELRRETISMLPLFEHAASVGCFCAVNKAAQLKDYQAYYGDGDFTSRMKLLKEQFDLPDCSAGMEAAVAEMEKDPRASMARRLK